MERTLGHRTRISIGVLIKSSTTAYIAQGEAMCDEIDRSYPVPNRNSGGILMGRRPVIGAAPITARPAAVCETGKPPHAARYVDTAGICCKRYGLPNATMTVRECR